MAFVSKKELHRGRSGTIAEKGVITYKRKWIIQRDTSADTLFIVLSTSGLPLVYEVYPEDTRALCTNIEATPTGDETGTLWEAEATYSTQFDNQQQSNPILRPPLYSCQSQQYTRPVARDTDGTPIMNLAGDYYDPPPEMDDARGTIIVSKNQSSLPLAQMNYVNAINSDQFFNNGPGTWKLNAISSGNIQTEGGTTFYTVTYEFAYRPEGWQPRLLEIGYNGLTADGKKVKFNSDRPRLLKDNGPSGVINGAHTVGKTDDPSAAIFTKWKVYRELPFSVFGFNL